MNRHEIKGSDDSTASCRVGVSTRGRRRKIKLPRFVAYLCLTWFTIAVSVEVSLWLLGFGPPPSTQLAERYDKFRPDPDLIWSLKSDWRGAELNGEPVTINSRGLRGPEVDLSRERPAKRILFLGDSVTFGDGLAEGLTIPDQLRGELNNWFSAPSIEVLNAGVPGYSTFQSAGYYRLRGKLLEPDLVLLGFCFNDVTERYTSLAAYGGERFFMLNVDTSVGMSWPRRLWQRTATRHALVSLLRNEAKRGEHYRVGKLWTDPTAPHIVEAWQLVYGEIDRLAEAASSSGARLAVVIYPYAFQLADGNRGDGPQRTLIGHLQSRGILFCDLLQPMKQQDAPAHVLFQDDNHFSALGSRLVAKQIAEFIDKHDLLKE